MPREVRNRRGNQRQEVPRFLDARVEIPAERGRPHKFRIVDISPQDLCFEVPPDSPAVHKGDNLTDVTIRAGHFSIQCHIAVVRTWKQFDAGTHCGARLYPKSDEDQNELVSLVSALESTSKGRSEG